MCTSCTMNIACSQLIKVCATFCAFESIFMQNNTQSVQYARSLKSYHKFLITISLPHTEFGCNFDDDLIIFSLNRHINTSHGCSHCFHVRPQIGQSECQKSGLRPLCASSIPECIGNIASSEDHWPINTQYIGVITKQHTVVCVQLKFGQNARMFA
jgi:hypothetical protein